MGGHTLYGRHKGALSGCCLKYWRCTHHQRCRSLTLPPPPCPAGAALPPLLQHADWKHRHAALICLSQIAEGCAKVMVDQTKELVQLCVTVSARGPCGWRGWG